MDNQNQQAVNQTTNGSQIPQEVMSFLEGILEDSGIQSVDEESRNRMLAEIYARLDNFMAGVIIDNMPDEHVEEFIKMNEEKKSKDEINKFLQDKIPDANKIFTDAFAKFREMYLGSITASHSAPK
jgi:hypothetical protein